MKYLTLFNLFRLLMFRTGGGQGKRILVRAYAHAKGWPCDKYSTVKEFHA